MKNKLNPDFQDASIAASLAMPERAIKSLPVWRASARMVLVAATGLVTVPRLNLTMQPLRFMELSLEDPLRSTLIARSGPMVVNLPRPERYALHKLLVYGERPQAQRTKARKDVAQAAALIDYLLVHDAAELAAMWQDVNARGPGWRKRLQEGFQVMTALYPACDFGKRLERAIA